MAQGARERIVVGIGEGASDEAALDWVATRASHGRSAVTIVMTADLLFADYELVCSELELAEGVIADRAPSTPVRGLFVDGSAAFTLLRASEHADLLVLGAEPAAAATGHALPFRLATQAPCATVLVPSAWTDAPGPVIVGIDGDETADAALAFAEREAAAADVEVQTIHAAGVDAPVAARVPALVTEAGAADPEEPAAVDGPIDIAQVLGSIEDGADVIDSAVTNDAPEDAPIAVDRVVTPALVVLGAGHRALLTGTLPAANGEELFTDRTPLAIVR